MIKQRSLKTDEPRNLSIGIVGGGQLAQMLCEAADNRNLNVTVQTSSEKDPAVSKADKFILYSPDNAEGTKKLAHLTSRITFENEWINIEDLYNLDEQGTIFTPSLLSLTSLTNKLSQRKILNKLNIPVSKWFLLSSIDPKEAHLPDGFNYPLMAKICHGGYDGKGTKVIHNKNDFINLISNSNTKNWLLESWVDYEQELALVASRDNFGQIRAFPMVKTCQSNQICDWVIAPANINSDIQSMALNIISSLLVELNYVGVLAIEFFYGQNGLLVNEIAPRTHNSAHFSIEACNSSQFDQQICIVAEIPVLEPQLLVDGAIMVNLIGLSSELSPLSLDERINRIKALTGAYLHWYGKKEERPGRKLGHVTFLLNSRDPLSRERDALKKLKEVRSIWPLNK